MSISKDKLAKISAIIEKYYYDAAPLISPWEDATAEIAELLDEDVPVGPYGLAEADVLDLAAAAVEDAAEAVALDSGSDIVSRHSASAWLWRYAQRLRGV